MKNKGNKTLREIAGSRKFKNALVKKKSEIGIHGAQKNLEELVKSSQSALSLIISIKAY